MSVQLHASQAARLGHPESRLGRAEVLAEPGGCAGLVPFAGRDREHRTLGVIHPWGDVPAPAIELDECSEADPGGAFVSVRQRMVLRQPDDENCRLIDELGIELGIAEPGRGSVEGRVGEL
jgi:hypothetical protein